MSNDNFTIKPSLINAWSARLAEQVPFCPCPPETAKPALVAVDGGILCCSYPKNNKSSSLRHETYSVNGTVLPSNLE